MSVTVEPGDLLAVAGASGSGKTTLLEILAGVRAPSTGRVLHDGLPPADLRAALGYLPHGTVMHEELPLLRALGYAARLRMPAGTDAGARAAAVDRALAAVGLSARAHQRVGTLSEGERRRACIGAELLTRPRVLFLDEPTTGLDPATGADLMGTLRDLSREGVTVVLTTHAPADLTRCDRVLFLAPDGSPAHLGPARGLTRAFAVPTLEEVYGAVARRAAALAPVPAPAPVAVGPVAGSQDTGGQAAGGAARGPDGAARGPDGAAAGDGVRGDGVRGGSARGDGVRGGDGTGPAGSGPDEAAGAVAPPVPRQAAAVAGRRGGAGGSDGAGAPVGAVGQWWLLTRRGAEVMLRSRLTAAVVIGSPAAIVAMFALLFRPGAFDHGSQDPGSAAMILFWIAFGGFFFGLTYGLLQICAELPLLRRERLTVLRLGPYLLSKSALLMPVLAAADAALLAVLRALDRLPAAGWGTYGSLFVTVLLASAAALALGLLASAAVREPSQATLMLPLLCFPQVLFSGAFVPVPRMAGAGRVLSAAMTNRWAFEGLGRGIGLPGRWAHGGSPLGPPLLASYGDSFGRAVWVDWLLLAGFTGLFLAAAWWLLTRRCPHLGDRTTP